MRRPRPGLRLLQSRKVEKMTEEEIVAALQKCADRYATDVGDDCPGCPDAEECVKAYDSLGTKQKEG